MTTIVLNNLALKFGLTFQVVKSWWDLLNLSNKKDVEIFFKENLEVIKAKPFLKWVGGKRQLIPVFRNFFPKEFNNYHKPFLGAGAVFFVIQRKYSYLSDINEELINAWLVVKNNPYELISMLKTFKYEREFYLQIRAWDREENRKEKYLPIQRAARFIYLNRTCFNGLYRVNFKWQFNVPFGRYKNPDFVQEENILNVSKLLNKTEAQIEVASFEKVLERAKKGDFVYFDPPYDILSDTANFTSYTQDGFDIEGQKKLAEVFKKLDKMGVKVMLSNHNTPLIRELYKNYKIDIVWAKRAVNSKVEGRKGVEKVVVRNYCFIF